MPDPTYPPLASLWQGMPGSEVYPPAPPGNRPYNPVAAFLAQQARKYGGYASSAGNAYAATTPIGTEEMLAPARDIMKLIGARGVPGR